jgi:molybdenum cofactor biosynthesis enzyme MoaA
MPWAKSPSLWLTGPAELLGFSGIPGLARVLQDPRRTVFLETDGMKLRRRIHEFRPNARLYLTVPLYGLAATRNARMQKEGAFSQAMEGIRAAHLSGFLICAHVVIESATDLGEIAQLLELLRAMKIDGVVITAPEDSSDIDGQKLRAARSLLGNSWWAKFSRLARQSLHGPRERAAGFAGAPGAEVATP